MKYGLVEFCNNVLKRVDTKSGTVLKYKNNLCSYTESLVP